MVDNSEGQTHLAFPNNDLTSFFVTRESSHVQLRMSLSTVAMGTLLEFQVIFFPKSDVFLQIIATYLVGGGQHYECYVNTKGTKVLGTHYPIFILEF